MLVGMTSVPSLKNYPVDESVHRRRRATRRTRAERRWIDLLRRLSPARRDVPRMRS
jgi:hypothetical protein